MKNNFEKMTKAIVKSYGYTQVDLCKLLNVSQPTIHRLMNGTMVDPKHSLAVKIIELYDARPKKRA